MISPPLHDQGSIASQQCNMSLRSSSTSGQITKCKLAVIFIVKTIHIVTNTSCDLRHHVHVLLGTKSWACWLRGC